MAECAKKSGIPGDEPQQVGDANSPQLAVKRIVDRHLCTGINQRPAALLGGAGDFDVLIGAILNALIDGFESGFQCFMQNLQRFFDRRKQDRRADLAQYSVFVLPTSIADQIILETAELGAILDKHITRFQGITQQPIDQKFVTIHFQRLLIFFHLGEQIALQTFRNNRGGEKRRIDLPRRLVFPEEALQEIDSLHQRCIFHPASELQIGKQLPQIAFERRRQLGVMGPLKPDSVERDITHVGRYQGKTLWLKQGKRFFLYCRKGRSVCNRGVHK